MRVSPLMATQINYKPKNGLPKPKIAKINKVPIDKCDQLRRDLLLCKAGRMVFHRDVKKPLAPGPMIEAPSPLEPPPPPNFRKTRSYRQLQQHLIDPNWSSPVLDLGQIF